MTAKVYRRNNPQPSQGLWLLMHDDGLFAEISADGTVVDCGTWIGPSVDKLIESKLIDDDQFAMRNSVCQAIHFCECRENIIDLVKANKQKQAVTEPSRQMTVERLQLAKSAESKARMLKDVVLKASSSSFRNSISLLEWLPAGVTPLPSEIVDQITTTVRAYYEEELRKAEEEFARS